MFGNPSSTMQLAREHLTLSQGTVSFSPPEDVAIRSLWLLLWRFSPSEAEVPFSPSEEKLIALWQKWGEEDGILGIFLSQRHLYDFFYWAKLFGFFTNVLCALDIFVWECMNSIFQFAWDRGLEYPQIYLIFKALFSVLEWRATVFPWVAKCNGLALFPRLPREETLWREMKSGWHCFGQPRGPGPGQSCGRDWRTGLRLPTLRGHPDPPRGCFPFHPFLGPSLGQSLRAQRLHLQAWKLLPGWRREHSDGPRLRAWKHRRPGQRRECSGEPRLPGWRGCLPGHRCPRLRRDC